MKVIPDISADRLRALLSYDPETGVFVWKARRGRITPGSRAGRTDKRGYRSIHLDGKHRAEHRLAWLYVYGSLPEPPIQLDHINRKPGDNRICNLRAVTGSVNCANRTAPKHKRFWGSGVTQIKKTGRWQVQVCRDRKIVYGGVFATAEEAMAKAAAMKASAL